MSLMRVLLFIASINLIYSCDTGSSKNLQRNDEILVGWKKVYQHDKNGNSISGSIDELIFGIRNGYDVRVGWGWQKEIVGTMVTIEHMASPIFLTIIDEKNVSVIIDSHPLLQSYININQASFNTKGNLWQAVLTTQGNFNAHVINAQGELIKDWPQQHKMTWFLNSSNQRNHQNSQKLF